MGWHEGLMLGGGFMWIFWILLIVAGAILVSALLGRDRGKSRGSRPNPVDILRERYARGEIERDEYEQKLKDLHD